jgi:hypothetical protein
MVDHNSLVGHESDFYKKLADEEFIFPDAPPTEPPPTK